MNNFKQIALAAIEKSYKYEIDEIVAKITSSAEKGFFSLITNRITNQKIIQYLILTYGVVISHEKEIIDMETTTISWK